VLRDPRRYGIKNTTDKVRRPGKLFDEDATPCAPSVFVGKRKYAV
jgi:hypothetical protein